MPVSVLRLCLKNDSCLCDCHALPEGLSVGRECVPTPLSGKETSWCFNLSVKVSENIFKVSPAGPYKVRGKKS